MNGQIRVTLRRLEHTDVGAILEIISDCRREYGLENRVQAILEPSDYALFEVYQRLRSAYFVAVVDGEIAGGAGVAPLADSGGSMCELHRMYLRRAYRGVGVGRALLARCLQVAQEFQFEYCYAETISEMTTAIAFYDRHGFRRLMGPVGRSGHNHNNCWMVLDLREQSGPTVGEWQ
jgi:putative acetyltransferase